MSYYIVTVANKVGERVPLRGTIFAFDMSRAQHFESNEAARTALDKASRFHKPSVMKTARVHFVVTDDGHRDDRTEQQKQLEASLFGTV